MTSPIYKYFIFIASDVAKNIGHYCKLRQMIRNRGSQITWYYVSLNNIWKNIIYKRVFEWLVILVGCKIKVGISPSKNICVICFIESPFKMVKNAFYFILKALFVLKIFKFLSWLFSHVGKTAWLERKIRLTAKFITSQPG